MANYPVPYQNNWGYGVGQQMFPAYPGQGITTAAAQTAPQATQTGGPGLIWVDGEVGAKAYQMPQGWPANQPIALWDTNDTCIYLKSINPMGMPQPLQRAHYVLEGTMSGEKRQGYRTEEDAWEKHDMSQYVRKDDLERMKQDLMDTIGSMNATASSARKTAAKGE